MAAKKIRVHNQGKREYTIPPAKKGGKKRMIQPGRAIEIEKDLAEKMIKAYPRDLVEFDSLVSGEKKDLSKENTRLESENASYLEKIEKQGDEIQVLKEKVQEFESNTDPDVQTLKDKIAEMEKELEEATKPKTEEGAKDQEGGILSKLMGK